MLPRRSHSLSRAAGAGSRPWRCVSARWAGREGAGGTCVQSLTATPCLTSPARVCVCVCAWVGVGVVQVCRHFAAFVRFEGDPLGLEAAPEAAVREAMLDEARKVSRSCACIGSPCLKLCVHGAPIQYARRGASVSWARTGCRSASSPCFGSHASTAGWCGWLGGGRRQPHPRTHAWASVQTHLQTVQK
jgi:hypothetical protein